MKTKRSRSGVKAPAKRSLVRPAGTRRSAERSALTDAIYRTLFKHSPTILYVVTPLPDGRFVFAEVNPAAHRLTGIPRAQMLGRTPSDIFPPEPARFMESKYEECHRTGETVEYDVEGDSPIGHVARHTVLVPLKARDGTVQAIFGTSVDTTEAQRLEEQLRRAQKMEAIGQLTSGIAHEFNNLLTAVIGQLEMLPQRFLAADDKAARRIAAAMRAADRGAKLTAQLLAFSRKQMILPRSLELNRVVSATVNLLEGTIVETIRIETAFAPDLWLAVADPTQVELAVVNLVINARDAMPSGGTVRIETANVVLGRPLRAEEPSAGEYVMVAVSDTGTGIPAGILDKVFEPFFTTKPVGQGSGLGLSQVLGVAQQLGGGIGLASEIGKGTTVRVYLPRASAT